MNGDRITFSWLKEFMPSNWASDMISDHEDPFLRQFLSPFIKSLFKVGLV